MRILVIVNPRSGGSDAGLYDFIRLLGVEGVEVVMRFATVDVPIESLLLDVKHFDRVVAAGGDGTVSAVLYGTRNTDVPVLAYPAGTANLLALNLGLPLDAPALAAIMLDGIPTKFDLGEIESVTEDNRVVSAGFTVMAGAGFDATIMESAQPLKPTFGAAAYLMAAIGNISPKGSDFELVLDGERIYTDGIAVLLINFGRLQFDIAVTHGWDPQDGKLDIAVVRARNVADLIPSVFAAMLDRLGGEHRDRGPGIDVYSASLIEVIAEPRMRMQYDGEVAETSTPFVGRCLPGAATLMLPKGNAYSKSS